MENSMSGILIEAVVRKALREIKENPERITRNLVDMALKFADGRFQKHFFESTQQMLQEENSAYYGLVREIVSHTDEERLLRFGMNLGYHSCTVGARRIREKEKELGFRIPWSISCKVEAEEYRQHRSDYQRLVCDGEHLGIYTWILFAEGNKPDILSLAEEHPDSAFFLFCPPKEVTAAFLDEVGSLFNVMPVVRFDGGAAGACALLREAQLPYSVYCPYSRMDLEAVINGNLFRDAQKCTPIFTVLLAQPDCPEVIQRLVYQAVASARKEQNYPTILWELYGDNCYVDKECCLQFQ